MADAPGQPRTLTPREADIARGLLKAASNKAIAHRLGLTEQSVKNRLTGLYRKWGVTTRLELVVALMNGREIK